MSFLNLMTNEIVVSRLTALSGNKTVFSTVTLEDVNIQRMSDESTIRLGGAIGKMFRIYAKENADIEVGDKLVEVSGGEEYKVVGITKPAELGAFIHKERIIVKVK